MNRMYPILFCAGMLMVVITINGRASDDTPDFSAKFEALRTNTEGLNDSTRLYRLFDLHWEYNMHTYPEWATWEGYPGQNHRWTDDSPEGIKRRREEMEWPYAVIISIDRDKLNRRDQLNYDLFRRDMEEGLEGRKFPSEFTPINQLGGVQQSAPRLFAMMPNTTVKEYEDILARMRGLQEVIEDNITLMEKGLEMGVTPPKVTMRDIPDQVKAMVTDDPMESPLLRRFVDIPESIGKDDADRLRREAVVVYRESMAPAFRKLHRFLVDTYLPNARTSLGMSEMPSGSDWYAYRVKSYTTTDLSPREIHETGLREVKRIREEMEQVIKESGFEGDFAAFTEFLRTAPQFYYDDAESLLQGYRDICKRADPELIKLFGKLPRMPYGVIPIPAYAEKSQTTAYYHSGSHTAGRPGYFFANTYNLKSRPKWEMEPLALHEAVPGHHLQISLAQELEEMPEFRKNAGYTAFIEGWGLYSESLGEDMGFYGTPYSKFGQLTYEMWRAIRLVVDVGIHEMGWTRDQALEFFVENSGKTRHDIEVEVDRYIVWPGQALAYKIGELKMKELRAYAEGELGENFDIRAFHDELLGNGALPLDVLERRMRDWVSTQESLTHSE